MSQCNAALPADTYVWRMDEVTHAAHTLVKATIWKAHANAQYQVAMLSGDEIGMRLNMRLIWSWMELEKEAKSRLVKSGLTLQMFYAY